MNGNWEPDPLGGLEPATNWRDLLNTTEKGVVQDTMYNVSIILQHAPAFKGRLHINDFAGRLIVDGDLPWQRNGRIDWSDDDTLELTAWLQASEMRRVRKDTVSEGVRHAALQALKDPVREYLEHQTWDGQERLDAWLTTYLGVKRTEYVRAIGPKVLIAAVARIMKPGCKVDTVLVLEGRQGVGKSTAIAALFGEEYVTDSLAGVDGREPAMQLRGKWAVELAELSQLRRAKIETIKAFVSRQVDNYRLPFAREAEDIPRRCVFLATTNETNYLKDATGNRRFWPVWCEEIDLGGIKRDRDQLWAEAVARYQKGERWHLEGEEIGLAMHEQSGRYEEDVWATKIDWFLVNKTSAGIHGVRVTITEIADNLEVPTHQQSPVLKKRISDHLKRRGWAADRTKTMRFYFPKPDWTPIRDDYLKHQKQSLVDANERVADLDRLQEYNDQVEADNLGDTEADIMSSEQREAAQRSAELLRRLIAGVEVADKNGDGLPEDATRH